MTDKEIPDILKEMKESKEQQISRHLCHEIIISLLRAKKLQSLYLLRLHLNAAIEELKI